MSDSREAILARLAVVLDSVTGIKCAARNRASVDRDKRPAAYLYDGDEAAEVEQKSGRSPALITMTPEIYIVAGESAEDIGTKLNTLRGAVLAAVLTDAPLAALAGPHGRVTYAGCATALSRGRTMEGEMGLNIAITYTLKPD